MTPPPLLLPFQFGITDIFTLCHFFVAFFFFSVGVNRDGIFQIRQKSNLYCHCKIVSDCFRRGKWKIIKKERKNPATGRKMI